ncbi:alpha-galactosidase [Microbacterium chocolatum]|uniref:alpha-galactosidase n=1 Tax=Microbacterium aurantiacum TaxID=162393 RepID=UPI00338F975F
MIHHLRAAGASLVLDARGAGAPVLVHWGRDLGPLDQDDLRALADTVIPAVTPSSIDRPLRVGVVATLADGWSGRPGLDAHPAPGPARHVSTTDAGTHADAREGGAIETVVAAGAHEVRLRFALSPQGVLEVDQRVRNVSQAPTTLRAASVVLPVPDRAREVLDFAGRWAGERAPQRLTPGFGTWLRESRHGRGGHDAAMLSVVGTPGFGFGHGEVWATHVAWSGDTVSWFERSEMGASVIGAGERLEHLALAPGETYDAPSVVAVWSADGLDGLSDRLHPWIRSWVTPRGPRPLTLNTWEAVYFDHSLERLAPLVDAARRVGMERLVLDDGWFTGRTDDRRALGDWDVDPRAWPDGLSPLIARVHDAGMQFGLWVEPEMVNADSDLARRHPEWLLTPADSVSWRFQQVLDLAHPDAWAYVFAKLDALLREYPIAGLKWDHNRDLLVADSRAQVRALYRLLDALRAAHPGVEIESCASGGARIDLGILRRTDRFWTSDTNDPLERQRIQRWTGILIPPELLGSHVGDERAHTTGRTATMAFRLATALFLHAGIESDISRLTGADLDALAAWTEVYRRHRALLHDGRVVRVDDVDDAVLQYGVVAREGDEALFAYAVLGSTDAALPPPARLPGLAPERRYRVEVLEIGAQPRTVQDAPPPWLADGVVLSGAVLAEGVLPMPLLAPGNAVVLHVRAV